MRKIISQLFITCVLVGSTQAATTAYDITYTTNWTTANDADTPGGAHFSPLIGATHNSSASFGAVGSSATAGIEQMAEAGGTALLTSEINANADANQVITQAGLGSVATTTFRITVDSNFSRISLFSMIAPSSDWFIAVRDFDLRSGGNWIGSSTQTFVNYDAGTESGSNFAGSGAGHMDTSDNIALLSVAEPTRFTGNPAIATLSFTRVVPEPSTSLLSGVSLLALALRKRR